LDFSHGPLEKQRDMVKERQFSRRRRRKRRGGHLIIVYFTRKEPFLRGLMKMKVTMG
jgi:hypothetical protein